MSPLVSLLFVGCLVAAFTLVFIYTRLQRREPPPADPTEWRRSPVEPVGSILLFVFFLLGPMLALSDWLAWPPVTPWAMAIGLIAVLMVLLPRRPLRYVKVGDTTLEFAFGYRRESVPLTEVRSVWTIDDAAVVMVDLFDGRTLEMGFPERWLIGESIRSRIGQRRPIKLDVGPIWFLFEGDSLQDVSWGVRPRTLVEPSDVSDVSVFDSHGRRLRLTSSGVHQTRWTVGGGQVNLVDVLADEATAERFHRLLRQNVRRDPDFYELTEYEIEALPPERLTERVVNEWLGDHDRPPPDTSANRTT